MTSGRREAARAPSGGGGGFGCARQGLLLPASGSSSGRPSCRQGILSLCATEEGLARAEGEPRRLPFSLLIQKDSPLFSLLPLPPFFGSPALSLHASFLGTFAERCEHLALLLIPCTRGGVAYYFSLACNPLLLHGRAEPPPLSPPQSFIFFKPLLGSLICRGWEGERGRGGGGRRGGFSS